MIAGIECFSVKVCLLLDLRSERFTLVVGGGYGVRGVRIVILCGIDQKRGRNGDLFGELWACLWERTLWPFSVYRDQRRKYFYGL